MSKTLKPFSAQDCMDLIEKYRSEIEHGEYLLELNSSWLSDFPNHILSFLISNVDQKNRCLIAQFNKIPENFLRMLSNDNDDNVRASVAGNPNTPSPILEFLARDGNRYVRRSVAGNPNTPHLILERLARDDAYEVQGGVAGNPNTPFPVLELLARDKSSPVRESVARNPNTPPPILGFLAQDEKYEIRMNVAEHPNTPIPSLEKLAKDSYYDYECADPYPIRARATRNPKFPISSLQLLAQSGDYDQKGRAKQELQKRGIPFTEENEKEHAKKTGNCFIATVVYDSPVAPQVLCLKTFRDRTLLSSFFGQQSVRWYYRLSPPVADFLGRHKLLKKCARYGIIDPLVRLIAQWNRRTEG